MRAAANLGKGQTFHVHAPEVGMYNAASVVRAGHAPPVLGVAPVHEHRVLKLSQAAGTPDARRPPKHHSKVMQAHHKRVA